ncbi:hypothetical protein [Pseudoduganella plicata]|uniref:hypothetical protein n=1 Tax=Pseudoduganella plicata TaxID=321984 RepID=UPI0035310184
MVAVVHLPAVAAYLGRVDGIERDQVNACRAHLVEELLRHRQGTHAVVDDVHRHPGALLLHQQIGEFVAQLVLVEDIRLEIDIVPGARNGLHHFGHRLRAVEQQLDLVAGDQRDARGGVFQCGLGLQVQRALVPALGQQGLGLAGGQRPVSGLDDRSGRGLRFRLVGIDSGQRRTGDQAPAEQDRGQPVLRT